MIDRYVFVRLADTHGGDAGRAAAVAAARDAAAAATTRCRATRRVTTALLPMLMAELRGEMGAIRQHEKDMIIAYEKPESVKAAHTKWLASLEQSKKSGGPLP